MTAGFLVLRCLKSCGLWFWLLQQVFGLCQYNRFLVFCAYNRFLVFVITTGFLFVAEFFTGCTLGNFAAYITCLWAVAVFDNFGVVCGLGDLFPLSSFNENKQFLFTY